ncbi:MAG: cysteine--tRNA ligase [Proteobacteria bacterium]|nr:cysteine--tRNA ligase [Pseudomonadota bacterium]
MSITVYNSLTRKKEEFVPQTEGKVSMYVCGPTVYALSHIGHARSAISFDVIYRYLRYCGYDVEYARNYTDVDDKIIARANEEGVASEVLAERNIEAFDADMAALGVELPTKRPKATETIGEIIEVISSLIEKGFAYESGGDVFYSVRKFEGYGKLSGKKIDELESGARISVNEQKQDPLDFALWKASKPGEPNWESPWGPGRPGWHIECTAMNIKHLGATIDIHGGGKDLIFPHHENEIAQSEAATGKAPFARYWLHNGFVNIEKEKMSKSIGNILNIRDALGTQTYEAIRLFLLSNQYRSPIDYTNDSLKEAETAVERFYKALDRIETEYPATVESKPKKSALGKRMEPILKAMNDDFNTAEVFGNIFKEVTRANTIMDAATKSPDKRAATEVEVTVIRALFKEAGKILGTLDRTPGDYFDEIKSGSGVDPDEIEGLIAERAEARKNKDFARADSVRDSLLERGIVLEDTPTGTIWTVKQ